MCVTFHEFRTPSHGENALHGHSLREGIKDKCKGESHAFVVVPCTREISVVSSVRIHVRYVVTCSTS